MVWFRKSGKTEKLCRLYQLCLPFLQMSRLLVLDLRWSAILTPHRPHRRRQVEAGAPTHDALARHDPRRGP
jgi:hypothetical protein